MHSSVLLKQGLWCAPCAALAAMALTTPLRPMTGCLPMLDGMDNSISMPCSTHAKIGSFEICIGVARSFATLRGACVALNPRVL